MRRMLGAVAVALGALPAGAQTEPAPVWTVTEVAGRAVAADAGVTLELAQGRIAGRSGCNRFTGSAELTAASPVAGMLALGPLAGTRMMCPPAVMALEGQVLGALARVEGWRIGRDGTLALVAGETILIRARAD